MAKIQIHDRVECRRHSLVKLWNLENVGDKREDEEIKSFKLEPENWVRSNRVRGGATEETEETPLAKAQPHEGSPCVWRKRAIV